MWYDCCSCFSLANQIVYKTLILHKLEKVREWSALVNKLLWVRLLWDLKHQSNWCRCLSGSLPIYCEDSLHSNKMWFFSCDRLWNTRNLNITFSSITIYNVVFIVTYIILKLQLEISVNICVKCVLWAMVNCVRKTTFYYSANCEFSPFRCFMLASDFAFFIIVLCFQLALEHVSTYSNIMACNTIFWMK
jgi:hypothetical protein